MSYGLNIQDANGRLLVSESAPALHFLGTAAFHGVGSGEEATIGRFRIDSPYGTPMFFVKSLDSAHYVGVRTVTAIGGNTYEAKVWSTGEGGSSYYGAWRQPTVLAFGPLGPVAPASPYGFRVLGPTGNVHFDPEKGPLVLDELRAMGELNGVESPVTLSKTHVAPAISCSGNPWLFIRTWYEPFLYAKGGINVWGSTMTRKVTTRVREWAMGEGNLVFQYRNPAESIAIIDSRRYL